MKKECIERAIQQDKEAQEEIIRSISDLVFNLSLRMLGDVDDAKDASQEIYMLILDKLSTFRFESKFSTWVYRVCVNYLIRARKQRSRYEGISFEVYQMDLVADNFDVGYESIVEKETLAEELKYSCSNVMLQCLDERSRCIFVLGTMFHIDSKQGAKIMDMSPENYRQILSRTRKKVNTFLADYCMHSGNCDCLRRVGHALRTHRIDSSNLNYVALEKLPKDVVNAHTEKMEEFETQSDFFAQMPSFQAKDVLQKVVEQLKEETYVNNTNG